MKLPILTKTGAVRQYSVKNFNQYVFLPHKNAYIKASEKTYVKIPTIWGERKVSTEELKHFFEFHVKHYFPKKIGEKYQRAALLEEMPAPKKIPKHHQIIAETIIDTDEGKKIIPFKVVFRTKRKMKLSTAKRKAKAEVRRLIDKLYPSAQSFEIRKLSVRKLVFRKTLFPNDEGYQEKRGAKYAPSQAS